MECLVVLGILLASIVSAHAQCTGDWVLARWHNGQHWFPGIIQSVPGDRLTIRYDGGKREPHYDNAARPYNWTIGSRVECNFKGQGWYSDRIAARNSEKLSIAYDDGDKENTRTGRYRSN